MELSFSSVNTRLEAIFLYFFGHSKDYAILFKTVKENTRFLFFNSDLSHDQLIISFFIIFLALAFARVLYINFPAKFSSKKTSKVKNAVYLLSFLFYLFIWFFVGINHRSVFSSFFDTVTSRRVNIFLLMLFLVVFSFLVFLTVLINGPVFLSLYGSVSGLSITFFVFIINKVILLSEVNNLFFIFVFIFGTFLSIGFYNLILSLFNRNCRSLKYFRDYILSISLFIVFTAIIEYFQFQLIKSAINSTNLRRSILEGVEMAISGLSGNIWMYFGFAFLGFWSSGIIRNFNTSFISFLISYKIRMGGEQAYAMGGDQAYHGSAMKKSYDGSTMGGDQAYDETTVMMDGNQAYDETTVMMAGKQACKMLPKILYLSIFPEIFQTFVFTLEFMSDMMSNVDLGDAANFINVAMRCFKIFFGSVSFLFNCHNQQNIVISAYRKVFADIKREDYNNLINKNDFDRNLNLINKNDFDRNLNLINKNDFDRNRNLINKNDFDRNHNLPSNTIKERDIKSKYERHNVVFFSNLSSLFSIFMKKSPHIILPLLFLGFDKYLPPIITKNLFILFVGFKLIKHLFYAISTIIIIEDYHERLNYI